MIVTFLSPKNKFIDGLDAKRTSYVFLRKCGCNNSDFSLSPCSTTWGMLHKHGTCYTTMGHATWQWDMLHNHGICYATIQHATQTWDMLHDHGTCYTTTGHATQPWDMLHNTTGHATLKWDKLHTMDHVNNHIVWYTITGHTMQLCKMFLAHATQTLKYTTIGHATECWICHTTTTQALRSSSVLNWKMHNSDIFTCNEEVISQHYNR